MSITVEDKKDNNRFVQSFTLDGVQYTTKSCAVWKSMLARCKKNSAYQAGRPTYDGCYVSENFSDFQFFANWYTTQVGYGYTDYQLDKDITQEGNRKYSEDTCVLVPSQLNMFFVQYPKVGHLPRGVSKTGKKFSSSIRIDGTRIHLGSFLSTELAHAAYKAAKEAEAYLWYERLRDGEFIVDPRVIERMRTWTLPENL